MLTRRRKAEVFLAYRGQTIYHTYDQVTGTRRFYHFSMSEDPRNSSPLIDIRDVQRQAEESGARGWRQINLLSPHNAVHQVTILRFAIRNNLNLLKS